MRLSAVIVAPQPSSEPMSAASERIYVPALHETSISFVVFVRNVEKLYIANNHIPCFSFYFDALTGKLI